MRNSIWLSGRSKKACGKSKKKMIFKKNSSMRLFAICVAMLLTIFVFGCTKTSSVSKTGNKTSSSTGNENQSADNSGKQKICMLGRSVMAGWFESWGSDPYSGSTNKGKYVLSYKELDTPPEIAQSAINNLEDVDKDSIVFFKFCFEDFEGYSRNEAQNSLKEKKEYVNKVIENVVDKRKQKMIIGNALPKVAQETDDNLTWLHEQYNSWLEGLEDKYIGKVFVFDQHEILADSDGNLRADYAQSEDDSHLTEKAYKELDEAYFSFLEENFE